MMFRGKAVRQKGFTLIELLIALALSAIIVLFLGNTISQVIIINAQNKNLVTAQRQVQQVGFYLSKDGQQARTVTIGNSPAGTGFPVVYDWIDLNGARHQVTFNLSSAGVVSRSESINGGTATTFNIATNISTAPADTVFSFVSSGVYNLKVSARFSGKIAVVETREYEIMQRTS